MSTTITIPKSTHRRFEEECWPSAKENYRYGQAFYKFIEADKIKSQGNEFWLQKLYYVDDITARVMILSVIDWEN